MSDDPKNRQYKDVSGNPVSLWWLVKNEPEWAVNQIRQRDKLESELNANGLVLQKLQDERDESNEYARKLSIKVTDQGVEIQRLQATIQRIKDAGDLLFEELDDLTPVENCQCIPGDCWPCKSCETKRARDAIMAWKEANK